MTNPLDHLRDTTKVSYNPPDHNAQARKMVSPDQTLEELITQLVLFVDQEKSTHDWEKDFDFIMEQVQQKGQPMVKEFLAAHDVALLEKIEKEVIGPNETLRDFEGWSDKDQVERIIEITNSLFAEQRAKLQELATKKNL